MGKKQVKNVIEYYSQHNTVKDYNRRRFAGLGGEYINRSEVNLVIDYLRKYLKSRYEHKILDLGAGRGRLSVALKKKGYTVYCLDSSGKMIKILRKHFTENEILFQSAFDSLNTTARFSALASLRFFDHFEIGDQKEIIRNISKNLKKNGFIIFCALNKNSFEFILSKFLYFGKVNYYYTDFEYRKLFESLDLKMLDFDSRFFLPRGMFLYLQKVPIVFQLFKKLDLIFSKIMPKYSAMFLYVLEK